MLKTTVNLNRIDAKLTKLNKQYRKRAAYGAANALMKELQHYPTYKHIRRRRAYGRTFQTARQRRWFFVNLKKGNINPGFPQRTGKTKRGWKLEPTKATYKITNDAEGAKWTHGNKTRARLNRLAGWETVKEIADRSRSKMNAGANAEVGKMIREIFG